jgi:hypothetical protein
MGVDFNKIGFGISSGRSHSGFGAIVANPAAPTGFPPYGTILSTSTQSTYLYWHWESAPSGSNEFEWGTHQYDVIADGNGGVFAGSDYNFVDTTTYNTVIREDLDYSQYTRIIYKGGGSWSECMKVAATGNTSAGTLYININGNDYTAGSCSYTEYYDGVCGTYNDQSNYWYSYGTYLTGPVDGYTYYCDGNGGYYMESASPSYPSSGTYLYSDGGSSNLNWNAPDGNSGTWTYASWGCSYYADGNGGSYSNCGGYTENYYTTFYSGSYSYENGTDEWGNTQYASQNFQLHFDGYSGYITSYE